MILLLVVTGWLYVAVMMAVAEANHSNGSVLGALFTFVLYGVAPVALIVWFGTRKARRVAREAREAAASAQPDGRGEAPADPVAPVRKEP